MPFHLYKMRLSAKVAVANMWMICIALLVIIISMHFEPEGWRPVYNIALIAVIVLSSPVGCAFMVCAPMGPSIMFIILPAILIPLNAYLWGYLAEAFVGAYKSHMARRRARRASVHSAWSDSATS